VIKRLRPSKLFGLNGIPSLVIKGCSDIFTPLLTYISNLSLTSVTFLSLWKQTAVVPVFKKGSSTIVSNYRPISILNNFFKIFEFIIYDHLYNFFKYRLNPSQHVSANSIPQQPVWLLTLILLYLLLVLKDKLILYILT
jgi:hypothetical protein